MKHLKVFGCIAFALIPSHKLHKLDEKLEKCIFLGYSNESKAYMLNNPVSCSIIISRDVIFHEDSRWAFEETSRREPVIIIKEKVDGIQEGPRSSSNAGRPTDKVNDTTRHTGGRSECPSSEDSPPIRTRLLTDNYNAYTFFLCMLLIQLISVKPCRVRSGKRL